MGNRCPKGGCFISKERRRGRMGLKILREMRGSALWVRANGVFQKKWPSLMPVVYASWAAIKSRRHSRRHSISAAKQASPKVGARPARMRTTWTLDQRAQLQRDREAASAMQRAKRALVASFRQNGAHEKRPLEIAARSDQKKRRTPVASGTRTISVTGYPSMRICRTVGTKRSPTCDVARFGGPFQGKLNHPETGLRLAREDR